MISIHCRVVSVILATTLSLMAEVDLKAPEIQAIREAYVKETGQADAQRMKALQGLIQKQLGPARQELAAKNKAGDKEGASLAKSKVNWLQECLTCVQPDTDFEIPPTPRPELDGISLAFLQEKGRIRGVYTNAVEAARTRGLAEFRKVAGDGLSAEEAPEMFDRLLKAAQMSGPMTASVSTNLPGQGPVPEFFETSGMADKWVAVGTWSTPLKEVDVVSIPVSRFSADVEDTYESPMVGSVKWSYKAQSPFTPTDKRQYRLRKLPDLEPVDVMEWPSSANEFTLVVRTHPAATRKVTGHGFEIQVDDRGGAAPAAKPAGGKAPAAPVRR